MPRTLGAKDKKKRKRRRLTNIAIGVGGAAALGGLGLLALRKKMPKVGNTMRPVTPTVSTSTATRVGQSSTPIAARTPQISPASSPPPRVTQPDIPAKPKLIPSRAEIQTGSVIPPQPIQQPKTIKALPPSRLPQSPILPTKPKLIPSRSEIQPSSLIPKIQPVPTESTIVKALPPARSPQLNQIVPSSKPKLAASRQEIPVNTEIPNPTQSASSTNKAVKEAGKRAARAVNKAKQAAKKAQEEFENINWDATTKKAARNAGKEFAKVVNTEATKQGVRAAKKGRKGIKMVAKVAKKSNKGRKKIIIGGIKKGTSEIIKRIPDAAKSTVENLPATVKAASKLAKSANNAIETVKEVTPKVGRRGFLAAIGAKAVTTGKQTAATTAQQATRQYSIFDKYFRLIPKTKAERRAEAAALRAERIARRAKGHHPLFQPHYKADAIEKDLIHLDRNIQALEAAGAKQSTRREVILAPKEYIEEYASKPENLPKILKLFKKLGLPSVNNAVERAAENYAKDFSPNARLRFTQALLNIGKATGLFSNGKELTDFIDE